jgi:hypothetical protein
MQLEWIESGLKRKSYDCFRPSCNSCVLNLRDYHRLLPLSSSSRIDSMAMGREGARAAQGREELDRRQGAGHATQGTRARGRGPRLGSAHACRGRGQGHGRPASQAERPGGTPVEAPRARAEGRALRCRGRGAGDRVATLNPRN